MAKRYIPTHTAGADTSGAPALQPHTAGRPRAAGACAAGSGTDCRKSLRSGGIGNHMFSELVLNGPRSKERRYFSYRLGPI